MYIDAYFFQRSALKGSVQSGWYESSWDLARGLEVVEDIPLESLPADWQDAHLAAFNAQYAAE